jgi:hypothetical protein
MAFKTREEIKAMGKRRYDSVQGIRIQSLNEMEISTLQGVWGKRYSELEKDDEGFSEDGFNVSRQNRRELVAMSVVDEDGERVFGNDEIDEVGTLGPDLVAELNEAAEKLSGIFKADEVDSLEKKSDSTDD